MQVRLFEEGDEERVGALLEECFGDLYTREFLRWKYRDNPWGFLPPALMEDEGEIVGHLGLVSLPFRVSGRSVLGLLAADAAVSPRMRKTSLSDGGALREMWNLVSEMGARRADLGVSIPVAGFYAVGRRYFGAKHLCTIPELKGVVSHYPAYRGRGAPKPVARALSALTSGRRRARFRRGGAQGEVARIEAKDLGEGFDSFWSACAATRKVSIVKDSAYLTWRYLNHPLFDVDLLGCSAGGTYQGFMALRFSRIDEWRFADILDFECRDGRVETAAALFDAFLQRARAVGTDFVRIWCTAAHPLRPFIDGLGLQPEGKGVRTLIYPVSSEAIDREALTDGENWLFAMGDSEGR